MATAKIGKFFADIVYKSDKTSMKKAGKEFKSSFFAGFGRGFASNFKGAFDKLRGFDKGDFGEKLGKNLVKGAAVGTAALGGGLLAAGAAFQAMMEKSLQTADDIAATSKSLGISIRKTQELMAGGIEGDVGRQGLLDVTQKLALFKGNLATGMTTQEERLTARRMGISASQTNEEAINALIKKAGTMETSKLAAMLTNLRVARGAGAVKIATALKEFNPNVSSAIASGDLEIAEDKDVLATAEAADIKEMREFGNELKKMNSESIVGLKAVMDAQQVAMDLAIKGLDKLSAGFEEAEAVLKSFVKVLKRFGFDF